MKRSKYLEHLSHDHHAGLQMVARIVKDLQDGAPGSRLAQLVRDFWASDLEHHFAEEERLLLPLMTRPPLAELGRRMKDEHLLLRQLAHHEHDHEGKLAQFADVLKQHIRFEERELFPAVETNVPDHVLLAQRTRTACISAALRGFEEAKIAGLCHEGAVENAIAAMQQLELSELVEPGGS